MGGSFVIESLTDEVEEKAMAYINHIRDELGDGSVRDGVIQGIQDGYFQREIQDAAYECRRVEAWKRSTTTLAGDVEEDTEPEILTVDDDVQERRGTSWRRSRRARRRG